MVATLKVLPAVTPTAPLTAAAAMDTLPNGLQGGPPTLTTLQRSMYPARQQPAVVDLTQPDPEGESEGDDTPID
eukprot:12377830-Prorocentrum_lima.AAC.1